MNEELIQELKQSAWDISWHVAKRLLGGGWSRHVGDINFAYARIIGPGHVRYYNVYGDEVAYIDFKNIRPVGITKTIYHPPVLKRTVIGDLNSSAIKNQSSGITLERGYTFNEDESTTVSQEAGVAVGIGIRQQIGYGGAASPVSGETEITASINAHYNKTWGTETSKGREISNTIKVPPKTEATISIQKSTSDFEQKAEYWCDLDYDIVIFSKGDYEINIESKHDLHRAMIGRGYEGDKLTDLYRGREDREGARKIIRPVEVHLEKTIKFSNASTGDVTVTERKL